MDAVVTSLLVVALVVAWIVVLVPLFAKSRDRVRHVRDGGRGYRVLRRASASLRPAASRRAGSSPYRSPSVQQEVPVSVGVPSQPSDAAEEWQAVQADAARRRPVHGSHPLPDAEVGAVQNGSDGDVESGPVAATRRRAVRSNWFAWARGGDDGSQRDDVRAGTAEAADGTVATGQPELFPAGAAAPAGSHALHDESAPAGGHDRWARRPGPSAPGGLALDDLADEHDDGEQPDDLGTSGPRVEDDLTDAEIDGGIHASQPYLAGDDRLRPVPRRAGRGGYDPEAAAAAQAVRYARRRRVAFTLLALTVVLAVLAGLLLPLLWIGAAITGLLLVTYLVYLRRQVRIEEAVRERRLARLQRARQIRPETPVRPAVAAGAESRLAATRSVVDPDDDDPAFEHLETWQPQEHRIDLPRASGQ
jgi:hypothetical protein